ncbi:DDB1- and CUL4-associated factor 10 homolog isoform X2 [Lingula anatina]|uniref:DDB1- and CUL4-associated factor 10 homolog isoform X2 n=1 Tax=Lingula anatina TaxID=7574 RepID=A0A1S3IDR9_LINAN|nr:DDB1- and CUL4-associated factor 10 homolog isoform X2 [Lingula anatina]|eukprot:XP_013396001.1 DDB1- and CUL4-associated factor 10 homolog isoform X2 [Lingula anatina]
MHGDGAMMRCLPHAGIFNFPRFLDNRTFATCSDDTTIALWDTRYLKNKVRTLRGHSNWVKNIEYASDQGLLVTSGFDGSIYTWDINKYSESAVEYQRVFHTSSLMRSRLTPDGTKLVIATAGGYLMVIHDLDLTTLASDLRGFKPNMYRLMQMSRSPIRQGYMYNRVFEGERNRVELISDFPEGDDAEMISSLQIHPQGWCALSRNSSGDENSEWSCIHDIQDKDQEKFREEEEEREENQSHDGGDSNDGEEEDETEGLISARTHRSSMTVTLPGATSSSRAENPRSSSPSFMLSISVDNSNLPYSQQFGSDSSDQPGRSPGWRPDEEEDEDAPSGENAQASQQEQENSAHLAQEEGEEIPLPFTGVYLRRGAQRRRLTRSPAFSSGLSALATGEDAVANDLYQMTRSAGTSGLQNSHSASSNIVSPTPRDVSLSSSYLERQNTERGSLSVRPETTTGAEAAGHPASTSGGRSLRNRNFSDSRTTEANNTGVFPLPSTSSNASDESREVQNDNDTGHNDSDDHDEPSTSTGVRWRHQSRNSPHYTESVTFVIRSGAQHIERTLLFLGGKKNKASVNTPEIHQNIPRLTHFKEEPAVGRGFIKELCFSSDGRIICSPYSFGIRLLAFNDHCSEMCDTVPTSPMQLYEVKANISHSNIVVSTKFSPTHHLLVSGCLNGRICFHQPRF